MEHRKISGIGAGEIGDCIVFVGNLIIDFDYEAMARVLKIPDAKFRDKVKKTIWENLSAIHREIGVKKADQWDEATFCIEDRRFNKVSISGDYFCFPKDTVNRLEREIEGSLTDSAADVVRKFYDKENFELPGIEINDRAKVFKV